jgi:hypothetical protein
VIERSTIVLLSLVGLGVLTIAFHTQPAELSKSREICTAKEEFLGPINAEVTKALIERIENCRPETLVINSEGGDEEAALQIANALRKNDVGLEVDKACLSACAQIIMLSASTVNIRPLTIIGLHHSAFAINEWSAPHVEKSSEYREIYDGSVALSQATARVVQHQRKLNLLRYAFKFVGPQCLLSGDAQSKQQWKIWMARQFWFPRRIELERAGLVVNDDWENIPAAISGSPDTNFINNDDAQLHPDVKKIGPLPHCRSDRQN